ncbi:MAG: hydantoinase/oxoprolinase family protein, partial [Bosea sp. (in: a-proteobacteria)]|nr:hydantoinase/oxoprolinase family protein [Bosea sp. (in: a-proteobacteria)]
MGMLRLGFDIGGTFTDFVLLDPQTGRQTIAKCLTTPHDPSEGVRRGLQELFDAAGVDADALEVAVHATTLITNALIERRGARTALISTAGFRDTVEMATELRYDNYDVQMEMPAPLVERDLRFDVAERLDRDGHVVVPLDEDAVRRIAAELRALKVEAAAIVFLHAFRNPAHERRAAEILAAEVPGLLISCSSTVSPEIREYERSTTTLANAYVQPIVADYLDATSATLSERGYRRPLHVMVSSGGVSSAETVKQLPIRMLESGPTAGVLAAIEYGRRMGMPNLVTFDMGGTTAKIGLVINHEAKKSTVFEVGRVSRFQKGSGLPIRLPVVELIEIGAGGGSIAQVDGLGLLSVGPRSAGSTPGPACYGRGGGEPTVTDANVVLGYLNPSNFLGGDMVLDAPAAQRAIEARLAQPLGMDVSRCAQGIFQVVNENMLSACKVHIAERGEDPRNFYLFSFGGAGPVHAYELARALGMRGVVVPPGAGAASAYGLVASPVAFDLVRSHVADLGQADWTAIRAVYEAMAEEGEGILAEAGVDGASGASARRFMDLRHLGQGREVSVEISEEVFASGDLAGISQAFYDAHTLRYGHAHRHLPVELITCRMTVSGPATAHAGPVASATDGATGVVERKGSRPVFFPEVGGYVETAIYERSALTAGARLP